MTRAVLAVMAGLLCGLGGLRRAAGMKAEAARLHRWETLLKQLALILGEKTASLPEAMTTAADSPDLMPDRLMREVAEHLTRTPMAALEEVFGQLCPPCTERTSLCRMFSGLSRGSLSSRLFAVEQCARELALTASQAQARADRDARLWQTLGWTGGACLTLLLL